MGRRARPAAQGLWHPHWPQRLVEALEQRGRSDREGGQHPHLHRDGPWYRLALPLLLALVADQQPVRALASRGRVRRVRGKLLAVLFLRGEVRSLLVPTSCIRPCGPYRV